LENPAYRAFVVTVNGDALSCLFVAVCSFAKRVNPNAAEMPARAPFVIPVFTGMTGVLKRLNPENSNSRVKILARQGFGKF